MDRRRVRLIIGGIVILGGISGLIVYSFNQSLVYDHSVSEYMADPSLRHTNCRIYGKVGADTVVRANDRLGISFDVTDGQLSVPVHFAKEIPDTFKEGGDVVVEGRMGPDGVFQARTLLAKCPSKYESEGLEGRASTPGSASGS
ncbi:MAG TPA: cytochrome c maturation protein CcmE [Candidatus Polarisedimenticolia bacterium]|nr:cytochrome c maturation protein CcmE [Candidatus Polarisedimenticolia bacterium]